MEKKTTIQVLQKTKEKLRNLGERNEDFDSIINRMMAGEFSGKKQKKQKEAAN
jgi:hypothetical protein